MAAYTDATKIAAFLGVTLTASQITQAGVLAQAASDWIDKYLGKSWQIASPATDELHTLYGDTVYLNNRPVASITTVKTRDSYADAPLTTLDASQWELFDAANGWVRILGWAGTGSLALVSYAYTLALPTPVGLAATMIAASWLGPTMVGLPSGLDAISLGQNDINVKFGSSARDVPPEALTLLSGYRSIVIA